MEGDVGVSNISCAVVWSSLAAIPRARRGKHHVRALLNHRKPTVAGRPGGQSVGRRGAALGVFLLRKTDSAYWLRHCFLIFYSILSPTSVNLNGPRSRIHFHIARLSKQSPQAARPAHLQRHHDLLSGAKSAAPDDHDATTTTAIDQTAPAGAGTAARKRAYVYTPSDQEIERMLLEKKRKLALEKVSKYLSAEDQSKNQEAGAMLGKK